SGRVRWRRRWPAIWRRASFTLTSNITRNLSVGFSATAIARRFSSKAEATCTAFQMARCLNSAHAAEAPVRSGQIRSGRPGRRGPFIGDAYAISTALLGLVERVVRAPQERNQWLVA